MFVKAINVIVVLMTIISQFGWGANKVAAKTSNPPVISEGDSVSVMMSENGSPTPFSLTLHAADPDGDTLTWSISTPAGYGTAYVSGTGDSKDISYTPKPDYLGSDSFVVQVSDGKKGTDTITVNVYVYSLHIRAYIDGDSQLIVQNDQVHWYHMGADAPGRNAGVNDPTYINGLDWYPTWPDIPNAYNRDCNCYSSTMSGVAPALPEQSVNYTLVIAEARYRVSVVQQPRAGNDYTLIVDFDDSPPGGAAWYEVEVTPTQNWISEGDSVSVTMSENGSPTPFSLTLHATNADGDTLTWSISTPAGHGTADVSGTGDSKDISYTPETDYLGSDSFVVQVSDGNEGTDTITVNVTINNQTSSVLIDVTTNEVYGHNLPAWAKVTISFNDPGDETNWDYTTSFTAGPDGDFTVAIDPAEFQIQAGQVAHIEDMNGAYEFGIPDVRVTVVSALVGTIQGVAPVGAVVYVQPCYDISGFCAMRNAVANGSGIWMADFSTPVEGDTFDLLAGSGVFKITHYVDDAHTMGVEFGWDLGPKFTVYQSEQRLETQGWPYDSDLLLTIHVPSTPESLDVSYSQTVQNDPRGGTASFDNLGPIQPGYSVTLTDGTTTKALEVPVLTLTSVDQDTNRFYGTANPNAWLEAEIGGNGHAYRVFRAEGDGNWMVDFSVRGGSPGQYSTGDIAPGTSGYVAAYDVDHDATRINVEVTNPIFDVRANNDQIGAYEWPVGDVLTLKIYAPGAPDNPVYTKTQIVGPAPWDPSMTYVNFNLWGVFDIQPGYLVSLSVGATTKTLTVSALAFTDFDIDNDTVSGVANAGARVDVWACDNTNCYNRHVNADDDGNWVADFFNSGVEGDEQDTFDLVRGTWVDSQQWDDDGDRTMYGQNIPNPYIEASLNGRWIQAREWALGTVLTLEIDDPSNGVGIDHTGLPAVVQYNPDNPGDPNDIRARFDWPDIGLQPGFVVTVTGNGTSKTLIIPALTVTAVDQVLDTVSGVATLGAQLHVCASIPGYCVTRWVTADPSTGAWTADYGKPGVLPDDTATVDLLPGSNGWVYEVDTDGDLTFVDWGVPIPPNPWLIAFPENEAVEGWEWPTGATVILTINNAPTDFEREGIAVETSWGDPRTYVRFDFAGEYDLKVGDIVTLTSGMTVRTHTVQELAVTKVDAGADTVKGTAETGKIVLVWPHGSDQTATIQATTISDGSWLADFTTVGFDLVAGTGGRSEILVEGNATAVDWRVLNPYIEANPIGHSVNGRDWPIGTPIHMTIERPEGIVTYEADAVMVPSDWDPNDIVAHFNIWDPRYDLQPGDVITMSDNEDTTISMIVSALQVTDVNADANTVSGTADAADEPIHVWVNGGPEDWVTVASGNWAVDFSSYDITPGMNGGAQQWDSNGNFTVADWRVPNPYIEANPIGHSVNGRDWPIGTPIHMTIERPEGIVTYEADAVMVPSDWDPNDIVAHFNIWDPRYDLQPGDVITMSDNEDTTISMIVSALQVTDVNADANTVSGTADAADEPIHVWVNGGPEDWVTVASGNWAVDFSSYDITPGMNGGAQQWDSNGNFTVADWRVPNPYFVAKPNNEQVNAYEWPVGDVLTLKIYAPGAPDNLVYTTTSIVVGDTPWNSGQTYAFFDLAGEFDIQLGYTVSISNVTTTKTLTVSGLTFTHIDIDNDLVEGVGNPDERVNVWACDWSGCYNRHAIADGYGNWSVDFAHVGTEGNELAIFNLVNGTWIDSEQMDDDGDCTGFGMNVSLPYIEVSPGSHWVHARGNWPDGTITMNIDDPSNGAGIDYSVDATFGQNPGNPGDPNDRLADFDLDDFDLQAGQVISMSGGGVSKTYTIQSLQVTGYDLDADTISGTGNSGHPLHVCINMPGYCVGRYVTVGGDGDWVADYHNPGARSDEQETVNLQDGSNGWVADYEDDGDQTWLDWNLIVLASASIGDEGGTLTTGNGDVSLSIPAGAMSEDLLFSITDQGGGYELAISDTTMSIVSSYTINPHGTTFEPPATVTFHWPDEDDDGIVDGTTTLQESHLLLIKDGLIYTPACAVNPDCDMVFNTLTVQVSSLSLFELAAPKDSDGDGLNDDLDACPNENPNGYDADHNGCTDTAVGLRQYLANLPANVVPSNIKTSLLAKVDSAIAFLNRGKEQAAIGQLRAFINEVEAQRGKKITAETADLLIAYARNVMAKIP
jgi:polyisoprenoid-binding protein YceI